MKRYDLRHDTRWFLGVSRFQWLRGILPTVGVCLLGTLVSPGEMSANKLVFPAVVFVGAYLVSWCAWLLNF